MAKSEPDVQIGSSPHARGTPEQWARVGEASRFIPACAGNASFFDNCLAWFAVHPRMRGERAAQRPLLLTLDGSSPHARGTLIALGFGYNASRFIPACAGNAIVSTTGR